jgi:hypothetical protein
MCGLTVMVARLFLGRTDFWNVVVGAPEVRPGRVTWACVLLGIISPLLLVGIDSKHVHHEFVVWQTAEDMIGPEEVTLREMISHQSLVRTGIQDRLNHHDGDWAVGPKVSVSDLQQAEARLFELRLELGQMTRRRYVQARGRVDVGLVLIEG